MKHNHFTREIMEYGKCPSCDEYLDKQMKKVFDEDLPEKEELWYTRICPSSSTAEQRQASKALRIDAADF